MNVLGFGAARNSIVRHSSPKVEALGLQPRGRAVTGRPRPGVWPFAVSSSKARIAKLQGEGSIATGTVTISVTVAEQVSIVGRISIPRRSRAGSSRAPDFPDPCYTLCRSLEYTLTWVGLHSSLVALKTCQGIIEECGLIQLGKLRNAIANP